MVVAVLKLFIPFDPKDDELFWEPKKICHYNIKSAYRLLLQVEKENGEGESSNATISRNMWKRL